MTRTQAEDALTATDKAERLKAIETLLKHPLDAGLRADLRRMYLDITDKGEAA